MLRRGTACIAALLVLGAGAASGPALGQESSDPSATAALVGHNPGCEELATSLVGSGSITARTAMARKYPTCGIAVLSLAEPWAQATAGSAELVEFHIPRG